MDINDILSQLKQEPEMIAAAFAGLVILFVLFLKRKRIQGYVREWRIQRSLNRIGCGQIRNLVCSDGLDGYVKIDRLALTRDSIVLIAYKLYGGNIYCAERISEWTQLVGQKSFKFENPLFELENQLTSLKLIIGNVQLEGYLFFNQGAEFPKGHPDRVLQPGTIPERFNDVNCETINPEIKAAWELLKTHHKLFLPGDRASVRT